MRTFTEQSLLRQYQGFIRQERVAAGCEDHGVTLTNQDALDWLKATSQDIAETTQRGYNQYLEWAINRGDSMDDFMAQVQDYNASTLRDYITNTVQQQAKLDFYQNSGVDCQWRLQGGVPECDVCQSAMDDGIVDDPTEDMPRSKQKTKKPSFGPRSGRARIARLSSTQPISQQCQGRHLRTGSVPP